MSSIRYFSALWLKRSMVVVAAANVAPAMIMSPPAVSRRRTEGSLDAAIAGTDAVSATRAPPQTIASAEPGYASTAVQTLVSS